MARLSQLASTLACIRRKFCRVGTGSQILVLINFKAGQELAETKRFSNFRARLITSFKKVFFCFLAKKKKKTLTNNSTLKYFHLDVTL
jgi:NADH:ubiquinone oxidoreductase subunit F (NADH-binding)